MTTRTAASSATVGGGGPQAETRCPVSGEAFDQSFFRAPAVPVFCNVLCEDREQALAVPSGPIDLCYCPSSGLVFNTAFDPALVDYNPRYENALHHSPRFRAYAEATADRLIGRYRAKGQTVVDVGCGDGYFLDLLCRRGAGRGVGFDPAYPSDRAAAASDRVTIRREYFQGLGDTASAALLCCRHVLEHVAEPVRFLRTIRRGLTPETVVYFEVPNGRWLLETGGVWDVIYEHCGYYTASAIRALFEVAGFEVLDVAEGYERQFLWVEARPSAPVQYAPPEHEGLSDVVSVFADRVRRKLAGWRMRLDEWRACGRRAVIWGAGSKGVTFLNLLDRSPSGSTIVAAVDVNRRKQGCFVAGTGHPIVAPDALGPLGVDTVVLMNATYRDEVAGMIEGLQTGGRVSVLVAEDPGERWEKRE